MQISEACAPKDLQNNSVVFARRDTGEKATVLIQNVILKTRETLNDIQKSLYLKAESFRNDNTHFIDNLADFKKMVDGKGGFINSHWCGSSECEAKIKETTGATIRCVPFNQKEEVGKCILCGGKSNGRVMFAKSY